MSKKNNRELMDIRIYIANNMNEIKSIKGFGNLKRDDKIDLNKVAKEDINVELNKFKNLKDILELFNNMVRLRDISNLKDNTYYEEFYKRYFNCDYGYIENKMKISDFISSYENLLLSIKKEMVRCLMIGVKGLDNVAVFTDVKGSTRTLDLIIVSTDIKELNRFQLKPRDWFVSDNLKGFEDIGELKEFISLINNNYNYIVDAINCLPVFNNKTGITLDKINLIKTIQKKIFTHYLYYKGFERKEIINNCKNYFRNADREFLNKRDKGSFIGDLGYNYIYLPLYYKEIIENRDLTYFKDILLEEPSYGGYLITKNIVVSENVYKGTANQVFEYNINRKNESVDLSKVMNSSFGEVIERPSDLTVCVGEGVGIIDESEKSLKEINSLNIDDIYLRVKTISYALDCYIDRYKDSKFMGLEEHLKNNNLSEEEFINFIEGESVDYLYLEKFKKSLE